MEIPRQDGPITLEGGGRQFRDLDLEAEEFLHVRAEQQGIDLVLSLQRPEEEGATTLVRVDSPTGRYGPEELLFIAGEAGRYRVVVEAPSGAPAGQYTFEIVAQRSATPEDRELTEADGLYWQGRRLLKERSFSEAAESLEQALAVFSRRGLRRREADCLEGLCLVREGQGAVAVAMELCDQAVERYRQVGDRRFLPFLLDRAGWLRLQLGRAAEAVEHLEEALALFAEGEETRGAAGARSHLGSAYYALGRLEEAREAFEQAVAGARSVSDRRLEGAVLSDSAKTLLALRRPQAALDQYLAALAIYRREGDAAALALTLSGLADAAAEAGDVDRAETALREALDFLERAEDRRNRAVALNALGNLQRRKKDFATAGDAYEEALKLARESEDRRSEAVILLGLGHLHVLRGDPARGLELCEQSRRLFVEQEDLRGEASARVRAAEALRDLARLREAWDSIRAGLGLLRVTGEGPAAKAEAKAGREPGAAPSPLPLRADYYDIASDILKRLLDQEPDAGHESKVRELRALAPDAATAQALEEPPRRAVRSAHRSIEEAGVPDKPVNPAHSDLPGGGGRSAVSEEVQRKLAAAQAAYRERRCQEALPFEESDSEAGQSPIEEAGVPDKPVNPAHSDLPGGGVKSGKPETKAASREGAAAFDPRRLGQLLVAAWKQKEPENKAEVDLCREYEEAAKEEIELRKQRRELPYGLEPRDLAEAGWGILVSRDEHPAVLHHLSKLLEFRRQQAGRRYKELTYYSGESARKFLWYRHGESPGILDPDILPYYILIVGDPETIPFEFQYELGINHAVGRIYFDDPADYARYAESVIDAEERGVDLPRRASFFAVHSDATTEILARRLAAPLENAAREAGWEPELLGEGQASKPHLGQLLGGDRTPGLLLVSGHGRRFCPGEEGQEEYQGALLTEEWDPAQSVDESQFFHGGDVAADGRLHGLIAFLFACYGAGTPFVDNFPHQVEEGMLLGKPPEPQPLALRPFIARLPQTLLRHGALAVVGHVDRGWTTSFQWDFGGKSSEAVRSLEDCLRQLLDGHRLGHALRPVVRRYTGIAAQLAESVERVRNGETVDEMMVAFQWTAHNDARNFILLGDPAVYLLGKGSEKGARVGAAASAEAPSWAPPPTVSDSSRDPSDRRVFSATFPLHLEAGVHRYASDRARQRGVSVEEWVNAVLRSRARDDGFPL